MSRRSARHYRESGYRFSENRQDKWWINSAGRKRRQQVISARNDIRQCLNGMGVFSTNQYIPGGPSWLARLNNNGENTAEHLESFAQSWADIIFMDHSRRGRVIFNATARSFPDGLFSELEKIAENEVLAQMSQEDKDLDDACVMTFKKSSKDGFVEVVFPKHPFLKSLGGLSKYSAEANSLRKLAQSPGCWPQVHAGAKILKGYQYGVGVDLILDEDEITVPGLVKAIEGFRCHGCKPYSIDVPLTPERINLLQGLLCYHALVKDSIHASENGLESPDFRAFAMSYPLAIRRHFSNGSVEILP